MCRSHSNPASNLPQLEPGLGDREQALIFSLIKKTRKTKALLVFSSFPKRPEKDLHLAPCRSIWWAQTFKIPAVGKCLTPEINLQMMDFCRLSSLTSAGTAQAEGLLLKDFYCQYVFTIIVFLSSGKWMVSVMFRQAQSLDFVALQKKRKKKNRKMWQVALYATFTWSVRWSTYRHLKESFFVYLYLRMQTSSHVHLQKHRSKIATHTLAHAQTRVYVDSVLFSSKLQYHSVQSLNCKNTVHCKGSLLVCERGKSKRNLSLITGTWTSKKSRV